MADTTHPRTQSDTRPATRTLLGEGTSFRAQATEAVGAEKGRWGRLSHPRFILLHCGAPVTAVIRCFTAVLLLVSVPATCAQRALRYGCLFICVCLLSLCLCVCPFVCVCVRVGVCIVVYMCHIYMICHRIIQVLVQQYDPQFLAV